MSTFLGLHYIEVVQGRHHFNCHLLKLAKIESDGADLQVSWSLGLIYLLINLHVNLLYSALLSGTREKLCQDLEPSPLTPSEIAQG